jgi:nucleoside phosphorylase
MRPESGDTVVVLTALDVEYRAVRTHLTDVRRILHPAGTLFEIGRLPSGGGEIAIAVIGSGNTTAAVLAERAIALFRPRALVFVGIAGALHDDIDLGDVVVATKVYWYHGGNEDRHGFAARPQAWEIPHHFDQISRHIVRTDSWLDFLPPESRAAAPSVYFRPVAAGEVVLNARDTPLAQQIRRAYGDAAAIEMESAGVSRAGHLNHSQPVLTIRGISDKADGGKYEADRRGSQAVAAINAAAFAIAVVREIWSTQESTLAQKAASARIGASLTPLTPEPAIAATGRSEPLSWRSLPGPAPMIWLDQLVGPLDQRRPCLELHLIAVDFDRLEVRRLRSLANELHRRGAGRDRYLRSSRLGDRGHPRPSPWVGRDCRVTRGPAVGVATVARRPARCSPRQRQPGDGRGDDAGAAHRPGRSRLHSRRSDHRCRRGSKPRRGDGERHAADSCADETEPRTAVRPG